ncbi:hypothetical protein AFA91_08690 [Mycolicibacterium goodii]|uniref:Uncharacterized protein n=1 Tax=Mycolicibacterium goodii TaxID=134601 RepID=A0A0K0XFS4_MYCGD|nr:hypothetical protein AFA91_08690 [Mycolicibacterium goodii]
MWVTDSVAFGSPAMAGDVMVTGSHGGRSAGEYAAGYGVAVLVCNDAGRGKNDAGIAGLAAVDAHNIAGVGVSHDSARIGDGDDVWENGRISYVNDRAAALGLTVGALVSDALLRLVDEERL